MPPRARSDTAAKADRTPADPEPTAQEERRNNETAAPMIAGVRLPLPAMPAGAGPKRVLWWGGLAALAVVGAIEWPVAVVVGAGGYIAERLAREGRSEGGKRRS
jgi:hypothetical protein